MNIIVQSESLPLSAMLDRIEWHEKAACRNEDSDIFISNAQKNIKVAKSICKKCDVKLECLKTELSFPDEHSSGTFGGLTLDERKKLRIKIQKTKKQHELAGIAPPSLNKLLESHM
ncbi:MAG: WhiB family transcriptional regulator [Candidatus Spechtbacterales bacterium]